MDDMTKPIDPFARLHWRIIDDARFATVYSDDSAFALYVRLHMAADMAWPASSSLPYGAKKSALDTLVKARVIVLLTGNRYRVPVLDDDRSRRQPGTAPDPDGTPTGPAPEPDGNPAGPSHAGASRAHDATDQPTNQPSKPTNHANGRGPDAFDVYQQVTGSWPSPKVTPWLSRLVDDHDEADVCDALIVVAGNDPTRNTLMSRVQDHLAAEAHRRSREAEDARLRADEEYQRRERERVDSMSPEERAAVVSRFREQVAPVLGGLVKEMP
jgi:hypothetical protein